MVQHPETPLFVATVLPAARTDRKTPILFVHGACHTGACFIATPDGRPGWAQFASARGRAAHALDWPGHGRSEMPQRFHEMSLRFVVEAVARTVARIGPVVLITHSMGAIVGWQVAELRRDLVRAIVALAPAPPANIQPPLSASEMTALRESDPLRWAAVGAPSAVPVTAPFVVSRDAAIALWAASDRFPVAARDAYVAGIVAESPVAVNERINLDGSGLYLAGAASLAGLPILVVTGDQDPRHPRVADEPIADYLGAEFVWLPDRGLPGYGHSMAIEDGNDIVAGLCLDWLDDAGV